MKRKDLLFLGVIAAAVLVLIILPAALLFSSAMPQSACVGVIRVNGALVTQDAGAGLFSDTGVTSSDEFQVLVDEASERNEIKAVLFEINSPGGSVVASSEMHRAAKELDKPKVMFFREVGASGGYYLATAGDEIISDPDALTGSIGVRTTFSDMSGLFGKLGLNFTNVVSGDMKDIGDPSRPPTEEEIAVMQAIVDEIFGEFKQIVLDAREGKPRFTQEGFDSVLDGRILSGRQAYALGLVDDLGSRKDAVKRAAEMGGITDAKPRECELSREVPFIERLFSSASFSFSDAIARAFASSGSGVAVSYR